MKFHAVKFPMKIIGMYLLNYDITIFLAKCRLVQVFELVTTQLFLAKCRLV